MIMGRQGFRIDYTNIMVYLPSGFIYVAYNKSKAAEMNVEVA